MESIKETLVKRLTEQDNQRSRSTQVNVGPSEIGGCSRRLWYKLNGYTRTNDNTLRLPAIMGTAIHTMIEAVFADTAGFETEVELSDGTITGHVDLIDVHNKIIWDWKTITKSGIGYFGSGQQIDQIMIYGYLANLNGYEIEQVGLVGIPRDGNEDDIVEVVYAYDEARAREAVQKLDNIKSMFEPPRQEKDASFCVRFCDYYGLCEGILEPKPENEISNPEMLDLIDQYKSLQVLTKQMSDQMDFAKEALRGTTGTTPDGTVVKWTSVSGRQTIDESAVQEALGYVPKKQGNGYERLTVK